MVGEGGGQGEAECEGVLGTVGLKRGVGSLWSFFT